MSDLQAARIAQNESAFRSVNESIEAGRGLTDAARPTRFVCECATLGCKELLELLPGDYEAIRGHPRRFVVAPGHELPEQERVVDRTERYLVVQKTGEAGQAAEELDPRAGQGSPGDAPTRRPAGRYAD